VFKDNQAVILAPYTFIDVLVQKLDKNIDIGAQDVSKFNQGAFTG